MNVGLVGLGIMGAPMARNLLRAGFTVTVATRTKGKAAEFAEKEASLGNVRAVETAGEVASMSDVVVVMVTDSPDVATVARGSSGLFSKAKRGTVVIDMSTISPKVTRELAEEARNLGIDWLDAPVSGGEKGAIEGTLTIMVGGNRSSFDASHAGARGNGETNHLLRRVGERPVSQALQPDHDGGQPSGGQ